MTRVRRLMIALPALAFAVVAMVLAGSALGGQSMSRTLVETPKAAELVAPAPDDLSAVTVSRDWREVLVSPKKK